MQEITIGKTYRHYKGNLYKIIALGKHSETLEDMIIYQAVRDGKVWVRPAKMWNEVVDNNGTPLDFYRSIGTMKIVANNKDEGEFYIAHSWRNEK